MPNLFGGRVALVTGAGSGIGRATALVFAREGARVIVSDLPGEAGEETQGMIAQGRGDARFIATGVTDEQSVARLIEATVNAYGRLDCAFNNAGINLDNDTWDNFDSFERTIAVNLTRVASCIRHEVRQMQAQGKGGAIVNTASINGIVGSPQAGYVGSKHAVMGLTRSAALAFAKEGIRVNAVRLGVVHTAMTAKYDAVPGTRTMIEGMTPLGRFAKADEIASAVIWLCSDQASFVTGHPLVVDGGATVQ